MAGSAAADTRPALTSVSIEGSAVVGATLRATFEAAGDPPTKIEYKWRRCKADKPDDCSDIKDAKAATYTASSTDLGFRLRVRVKLRNSAGDDEDKSFPTAVVSAAPPSPPPAPPQRRRSSPASPAPSRRPGARCAAPLAPVPGGAREGLHLQPRLSGRSVESDGTAWREGRRALQRPPLPPATTYLQTRSPPAARALPARGRGRHHPRHAAWLHRQVHAPRDPRPQTAQAARRLPVPRPHPAPPVPVIACPRLP